MPAARREAAANSGLGGRRWLRDGSGRRRRWGSTGSAAAMAGVSAGTAGCWTLTTTVAPLAATSTEGTLSAGVSAAGNYTRSYCGTDLGSPFTSLCEELVAGGLLPWRASAS